MLSFQDEHICTTTAKCDVNSETGKLQAQEICPSNPFHRIKYDCTYNL